MVGEEAPEVSDKPVSCVCVCERERERERERETCYAFPETSPMTTRLETCGLHNLQKAP